MSIRKKRFGSERKYVTRNEMRDFVLKESNFVYSELLRHEEYVNDKIIRMLSCMSEKNEK